MRKIGEAGSGGLDFKAMREYARTVGGPALRALTFHQRAAMLKALAKHLMERKDAFYALSAATGATKADSWVDIDGGIGTFFAYSSRGRREFPNETFHVEGPTEPLSKGGTFVGRHICVPLEGVAMHINAFNFPVLGHAGEAGARVAGRHAVHREAGHGDELPDRGGVPRDDRGGHPAGGRHAAHLRQRRRPASHVTEQDAVAFTGSAATGQMLKESEPIVEQLACASTWKPTRSTARCLGPTPRRAPRSSTSSSRKSTREMTTKAGQKCTAIRRTIVPAGMEEDVVKALRSAAGEDHDRRSGGRGRAHGPARESRDRCATWARAAERIRAATELVFGGGDFAGRRRRSREGRVLRPDADGVQRAVQPSRTARHRSVRTGEHRHAVSHAGRSDRAGEAGARVVVRIARHRRSDGGAHGDSRHRRLSRSHAGARPHSAKESTGHGSPLPNLVHGGPGRAGGGEEMGGARGVLHYMQRTAVQGSPSVLTAITREWTRGRRRRRLTRVHPFRKTFDELHVGDTLITGTRTITLDDIVNVRRI